MSGGLSVIGLTEQSVEQLKGELTRSGNHFGIRPGPGLIAGQAVFAGGLLESGQARKAIAEFLADRNHLGGGGGTLGQNCLHVPKNLSVALRIVVAGNSLLPGDQSL